MLNLKIALNSQLDRQAWANNVDPGQTAPNNAGIIIPFARTKIISSSSLGLVVQS